MSAGDTKEKRLFINMAAQIVSFAVNAGVSFFLTPFIVEKLGRETYGFVGLANDFVSYAQIFVTALNSMASRFLTISIHREEFETANQYFSSLLIANAVIAAVLAVPAVLVVIFLDRILNVPAGILSDVQILWALLFIEALVEIVASVFGSATYVKNRLDLSSRRSIESDLLRAAILLVSFLCLRPHVYYLGIAAAVCVMYRTAANVHYTRMLLPEVEIRRKHFRWSRVKELLASGVWNSVTQVGSLLSNELHLLITNLLVGASAMGLVSVAKTLPIMVLALFGVLAGVFVPQLNISYARNNFDDMRNLVFFAVKLLGMIACIPVACVVAFGDIFFSLWVPSEDAILLQWIAIAAILPYPISLQLEPLWHVFTVTNRRKVPAIFFVMNAFVSTGVTFVLLKFAVTDVQKMLIVVGTSSVGTLLQAATFLPIYGAKCLHLKLTTFYHPMAKNLFAMVIVTVISVILRQVISVGSWLSLVALCCVIGVVTLAVCYFVLLQSEDRRMLRANLGRLLDRNGGGGNDG